MLPLASLRTQNNSISGIISSIFMKRKQLAIGMGYFRKLSTHIFQPFPSLRIRADSLVAQGPFAESQATYLNPDKAIVSELDKVLQKSKMGIVAHFYMDPELQGSLNALVWPHIFIADSLAMGDAAVKMAKTNQVDSIACLGVDFMSEGVRAVLDHNGFQHIPVYRLSEKKIGCSLAESAERAAYMAYLQKAAETPKSLHVVYINTSMVTKAHAQSILPTLTCTSSNVIKTILSAFAQVPDLNLWYGPDTYMGRNIKSMFEIISGMSDEEIAKLHPAHNQKTLKKVLENFHYFQQGMCVVHHMFGDDVVQKVRKHYSNAYHTAHLEVPGEMFALAMEAQQYGNGAVGSTSNILDFIAVKTREALAQSATPRTRELAFVLGTEAGMITSIVKKVQEILKEASNKQLEVEIIFPVAGEAVARSENETLGVVPGVMGGEGCSTAGGCATCPYMKMNSLDALTELANKAGSIGDSNLDAFLPQRHSQTIKGKSIMDLGAQPILSMRSFMSEGLLPTDLVQDILTRNRKS